MLQVKHLTILHKKDLTTLIEDLTFSLAPGARAAVIGEEGNGKSTLLKLLYDPALVEGYVEWSGEILDTGLRKGYLAQELPPETLALPLWQFCTETPGFAQADPRAQADAARQVGLPAEIFWDERPLGSLSGGERVKLRLALLLLDAPDLLLLDEPSNDLDLATLGWLEQFLQTCPVPVLFISHDEALLTAAANQIIHLERLRRRTAPRATVARMGYEQYARERLEGFAKQEQTARKERAEFDAKLARYRQIRDKVDHQLNTISRQDPHGGRLLKKKMQSVVSTGRRFAREEAELTALPEWEEAIFTAFDPERSAIPAGKTVLRFTQPMLLAGGAGAFAAAAGPAAPAAAADAADRETPAAPSDTGSAPPTPPPRVLARNIALWVEGPEHIGIVGANGAGKSTLLKQLAAQLLPRADLRAAYMPQDYGDLLLGSATPVELLAPGGSREEITRARTLLGSMKYKAEEMDHPAAMLSGGQRAKLLFLGMVLRGSNVLLLDEPTRNFSPLSAPVIRRALAAFPGAILSVSHDRRYLAEVCTRLLLLDETGLHELPAAGE